MEINHFADKHKSEMNFGAIISPSIVPPESELATATTPNYTQYIPAQNLT